MYSALDESALRAGWKCTQRATKIQSALGGNTFNSRRKYTKRSKKLVLDENILSARSNYVQRLTKLRSAQEKIAKATIAILVIMSPAKFVKSLKDKLETEMSAKTNGEKKALT